MTKPNLPLTDHVLIEMVLDGRTECFDELMTRHESAVRGRIRSMTFDPSNEDDFVQEVFLKAWVHLGRFRSESSFRTWITRIAINEVMQFYRRESHAPICPALADLDSFASSFESPHQSFERSEVARRVRGAIAALPPIYRDVLVLRKIEQLSEAETARSLRGTVPMVKTRLFRARQLLSAALRRKRPLVAVKFDRTIAHARDKSQIEPIGNAA